MIKWVQKIYESRCEEYDAEEWISLNVILCISAVAICCAIALYFVYWREQHIFYLIHNTVLIASYAGISFVSLIGKFFAARVMMVLFSLFWIGVALLIYDMRVGIEYFLYDLAITPFVIFLKREWKWAAVTSFLSFVLLVVIQYYEFPQLIQFRISENNIEHINSIFAVTAFFGFAAPFILVHRLRFTVGQVYLQEFHQTSHNDHLKTMGEISAGIAHEISNPLAIISGRIAMIKNLKDSKDLSNELLTKCRDSILKQITRIEAITNSLRNLGYSKEAKTEINPESLYEDCLFELSETLAVFDIKYETRHSSDGARILGNPDLIKRVFINLLQNSIDAICNIDQRWIQTEFIVLEQMLEISIMDSGCRIPSEISKDIFRPFFSTKPPGKGTGLGLSIVKKILNDHNAHFFLDKRNQNTRFVIYIPLA